MVKKKKRSAKSMLAEPLDTRLVVLISSSMRAELDEIREESGTRPSEFVRRAVAAAIDEYRGQ